MSRTIRRTEGYLPWWVGTDWSICSPYYRVPLEGKALEKALSKYHGDHGFGPTTNRCKYGTDEAGLRSHCKQEIQQWKQNPEYEVQFNTKRYLRMYWD